MRVPSEFTTATARAVPAAPGAPGAVTPCDRPLRTPWGVEMRLNFWPFELVVMLQYDDAQRLSQELSRVADRSAVCPPITVPARLYLDRATVENEWVRSRHRTPSIL